MGNPPALEGLLRRDQWVVAAGLTIICVICWAYIFSGAGTGMSASSMSTLAFPPKTMMASGKSALAGWSPDYLLTMLAMWWVMMIAMMTPSAAPMILLYARVFRHGQKNDQIPGGPVPVWAFAGGYLAAWLAFSLAATGLQWLLERAGHIHPMMMWSTSTALSGAFLVAAGVYQLSPLKYVCLKHCRSPVDFLSRHWRKGQAGALRMGVDHGLYCVGCCWFLMALLFVGGVMNLFWIAGLAIFVLLEKLAPFGLWIARISGVLMISAGIWVLVS